MDVPKKVVQFRRKRHGIGTSKLSMSTDENTMRWNDSAHQNQQPLSSKPTTTKSSTGMPSRKNSRNVNSKTITKPATDPDSIHSHHSSLARIGSTHVYRGRRSKARSLMSSSDSDSDVDTSAPSSSSASPTAYSMSTTSSTRISDVSTANSALSPSHIAAFKHSLRWLRDCETEWLSLMISGVESAPRFTTAVLIHIPPTWTRLTSEGFAAWSNRQGFATRWQDAGLCVQLTAGRLNDLRDVLRGKSVEHVKRPAVPQIQEIDGTKEIIHKPQILNKANDNKHVAESEVLNKEVLDTPKTDSGLNELSNRVEDLTLSSSLTEKKSSERSSNEKKFEEEYEMGTYRDQKSGDSEESEEEEEEDNEEEDEVDGLPALIASPMGDRTVRRNLQRDRQNRRRRSQVLRNSDAERNAQMLRRMTIAWDEQRQHKLHTSTSVSIAARRQTAASVAVALLPVDKTSQLFSARKPPRSKRAATPAATAITVRTHETHTSQQKISFQPCFEEEVEICLPAVAIPVLLEMLDTSFVMGVASLVSSRWGRVATDVMNARFATQLRHPDAILRCWTGLRRRFPRGKFVAEGSYKQVFSVWNELAERQEAVSVMNVDLIVETGNAAVVAQEGNVALMLSGLVSSGLCPHFVQTYQVFQFAYSPPIDIWGVVPDNDIPISPNAKKNVDVEQLGKIVGMESPNLDTEGCYQYISMELCSAGDAEEYLKLCADTMLDEFQTLQLLFQTCFSLLVARQQVGLTHYDLKLLNIFLSVQSQDVDASAVGSSSFRYSCFGYTFQLQSSMPGILPLTADQEGPCFLVAKLADYGTAETANSDDDGVTKFKGTDIHANPSDDGSISLTNGFDNLNLVSDDESEENKNVDFKKKKKNRNSNMNTNDEDSNTCGGDVMLHDVMLTNVERHRTVAVENFTTLENTPIEFMLVPNCPTGFAADSFALGISALHLYTGSRPYEELLETVTCPPAAREALLKIWNNTEGFDSLHVILEDDPDGTMCDTLYRYLVLTYDSANVRERVQEEEESQSAVSPWPTGDSNVETSVVYDTIRMCLDADFTPTQQNGKKPRRRGRVTKAIKQTRTKFQSDCTEYSLAAGTNKFVKRARERMLANGGHVWDFVVIGLLAFSPTRRPTMTQAIVSDTFALLRVEKNDETEKDGGIVNVHDLYSDLSIDDPILRGC